jgi:hypothetical protein
MKTRAKHEAEAEELLKKIDEGGCEGEALFQSSIMAFQGKIVDLLLDIHEMLDNRLPNKKEGEP